MAKKSTEPTTLEKLETAQQIQNDILDNLETDDEREAVLAMLKAEGIEITGEEEANLVKESLGEEEGGETKTGTETNTETETGTETETETNEETESETAALQKQLDAQAEEIAALRQKQAQDEADAELRRLASEKVQESLTKFNEEKEQSATKIDEYRNLYGDEAADELKKQQDEIFQLKSEQLKNQQNAEYAKLKANFLDQQGKQAAGEQEIAKVPDLYDWYKKGDPKDANKEDKAIWNYAIETDNLLRNNPQWADKSKEERYVEVAKRVRADLGIQPRAQKSKTDGDSRTQLQDLLTQKQTQTNVPESLTNISGGITSAQRGVTAESLEKIDVADLAAMDLTSDQLDRISQAIFS